MASLEACKPFRNLNPTEQAALRKIAVERSFSAGEQIFGEGDSGDGIYALKEGAVEISVAMSQNVRRTFAKLGPGEIFGEMAVLELKPRSATATATIPTQVYFIPREALLLMLGNSPRSRSNCFVKSASACATSIAVTLTKPFRPSASPSSAASPARLFTI